MNRKVIYLLSYVK